MLLYTEAKAPRAPNAPQGIRAGDGAAHYIRANAQQIVGSPCQHSPEREINAFEVCTGCTSAVGCGSAHLSINTTIAIDTTGNGKPGSHYRRSGAKRSQLAACGDHRVTVGHAMLMIYD